jgi:hypothetical protein
MYLYPKNGGPYCSITLPDGCTDILTPDMSSSSFPLCSVSCFKERKRHLKNVRFSMVQLEEEYTIPARTSKANDLPLSVQVALAEYLRLTGKQDDRQTSSPGRSRKELESLLHSSTTHKHDTTKRLRVPPPCQEFH